MLKEFQKFVMRGNVLDLAVGVIIGAAFGKIVTSLVNDILMPPLGKIIGGVDFTNLFLPLSTASFPTREAAKAAGVPILAYGNFLQSVVDFLIMAFAIFLLLKIVAKIQKQKDETKAPSEDIVLLREIRDLLKK